MPPSGYRALTPIPSPFAPFTHDRWRSSPTPEPLPCPKDGSNTGHIVWDHASTPPTPPLTYLPLPHQQSPGPSAEEGRDCDIDDEIETDDESCGPVTPHLRVRSVKWGWEDSPFNDDRWMIESGSEEDVGADKALSELEDPPVWRRGSKVPSKWEDSPFRDQRWMEEPVLDGTGSEGEEWGWAGNCLGFDGDCQVGSGESKGSWWSGEVDRRPEYLKVLEHEATQPPSPVLGQERPARKGRKKLRGLLWPNSTPNRPIPTQSQRVLEEIEDNFDLDEEEEQALFWLGRHRRSPSPISAPQDQDEEPHLGQPYSSPPPARRDRPPTLSPDPVAPLHLATHLSSRYGHTRMLDSALRLINEQDMAGLSMFLYCPKRHVREIWSEEKVRDVRLRLERLELARPGFRDRVFVHAHETINLACPPPSPTSRSTPRSRPTKASDADVYESTIEGLSNEMTTLEQLGLKYLVVHPGSSIRCGGEGDDRATLQIIANNIDTLLKRHPSITLVLESMTCTNHRLAGTSLSSLAEIRTLSAYPSRIKYCLDLSHVHSMSHDLSTSLGRQLFFDDVRDLLGGENVICGHVSECGVSHGTGRDVHADFGSGFIGDSGFRAILTHPSFTNVTWIIETPRYLASHHSTQKIEALEVDRQAMDIAHLRGLAMMPSESWADSGMRRERLQARERDVKVLRRKMWAEVKGGQTQVLGEREKKRARDERKKRGRLGIFRARARKAEKLLMEGGDGEVGMDLGLDRSPRRDREALLAKNKRKRRRSRGP